MVRLLRVLLVDDDEDFLDLLSGFLARHGYTVVACNSLDACLGSISVAVFDLAVIDGSLRGRDGCVAVEALRTADQDVTIVVLSGRDGAARQQEAFDAGADRYMIKPCAMADIQAVVREVADQRRMERRLQVTRMQVGDG